MVVGVLHPGEMGAALGAALRAKGETVLWASTGRSPATAYRASTAGLTDVVTVEELARRSEVILSICPPHAALEVARSVAGFDGIYVDANAVSPRRPWAHAGGLDTCRGRARLLLWADATPAVGEREAVGSVFRLARRTGPQRARRGAFRSGRNFLTCRASERCLPADRSRPPAKDDRCN